MSGPPIPPLCYFCSRYEPGIDQPDQQSRCTAFPEGIPSEITQNLFDHRHQLDQEQFLFEAAQGVTGKMLAEWEDAKQLLTDAASGAFAGQPTTPQG
jgi:hypothetical protein